jgi:hypothetical protein
MNIKPTEREAETLRVLPKSIGKLFKWGVKQQHRYPVIKEHTSPVEYFFTVEDARTGDTIEGLIVRATCYQPIYLGASELRKYNFGLHYNEQHRIYGLDVDRNTGHRNKPSIGRGKPFHAQRISGCHRHYWCGSYGYAEPLSDDEIALDMEAHWQLFCELVCIRSAPIFNSPYFSDPSGQEVLL